MAHPVFIHPLFVSSDAGIKLDTEDVLPAILQLPLHSQVHLQMGNLPTALMTSI